MDAFLVVVVLVGVLSAECQELLQGHNLIVEFDFRLGEDAVADLGIVRVLSQLTDLLSDCSDFSTIVLIDKKSLFILSCVLMRLSCFIHPTNKPESLTICIDVIEDLVLVATCPSIKSARALESVLASLAFFNLLEPI